MYACMWVCMGEYVPYVFTLVRTYVGTMFYNLDTILFLLSVNFMILLQFGAHKRVTFCLDLIYLQEGNVLASIDYGFE